MRRVVEEVIGRPGEQLAKLVARNLVEAGIDRRLTYALLDHHAGAEAAHTIYAAAVAGLRRRLGEEREP